MSEPETFTPSKALRDYYRRYHRGETDSPVTRKPSDFDFACSADWRDFYEQRHSDIDFPVSVTYARHYRSIGLMPALPEEKVQLRPRLKPPTPQNWLKIGAALAETHRRKTPDVKGVLR